MTSARQFSDAEASADRIIAALEAYGSTVKMTGESRCLAQCPAHADRSPSLSVGPGAAGCAVVHCHAGCDTADVLRPLGLSLRDLFADRGENRTVSFAGQRSPHTKSSVTKPKLVAPLPSDDQLREWSEQLQAHLKLLALLRELRGWSPEGLATLGVGFDGERIVFPIRDGAGTLVNTSRWTPRPTTGQPKIKALPGRARDLFPAPESVKADVVFITEGEGDAVAAATLGLPASSIPGTEAADRVHVERFRRFRSVNVLLDCDQAGRDAAERLGARLAAAGIEARVLDLDPSRDDKYDLSDFTREAAESGGLEHARQLLERMAADAAPVQRAAAPGTLRIVRASDVRIEPVRFLEPERVPLGAVTLLVGDPGLGKSTWSCLTAARTTTGANGDAGTVLMANAEDSPKVIAARLAAAGAALSHVEFFDVATEDEEGRPFELPGDVPELEVRARDSGARLVVLDPLTAFLSDKVNTKSDHSIRRALVSLSKMAERLDIAVIVVAHLNKSVGTNPLYRVGGSIGIVGGARSCLLFTRDPDDPDGEQGDRRALGHVKSNWGKEAETLIYRHEVVSVTVRGETDSATRLVPEGISGVHGTSLLGVDPDEAPADKHERANEVLADVLGDGEWHRSSEVRGEAKRRNIAVRTLQRAAKQASVDTDERGFPRITYWRLPQSRQPSGATVAPDPWRDCESPISTGDSARSASQSRHISEDGATEGATAVDPHAHQLVAEFMRVFPGTVEITENAEDRRVAA